MDKHADEAAGEGDAGAEGGAGHAPVLVEEVLSYLDPQPGQTIVDATIGRGGHAGLILERIVPGGTLLGLDLDRGNINHLGEHLVPRALELDAQLILEKSDFRDLPEVLGRVGLGRVDGLLADLGFASTQMDDPQRGMSFQEAGPLDMRLDPEQSLTASELVNGLGEGDLADLIYTYGEERLSRRIARKIVEQRAGSPIETTEELAGIVRRAYGPRGRRSRIDPATRTFMALRIAVNGELEALEGLLEALPRVLRPGGKAVIISFHSLEDRRVKRAFQSYDHQGMARRLTRKPVVASEAEARANRRSRSAKLRALAWGQEEESPA